MESFPTIVEVTAGALVNSDGAILLHRRRFGAEHGGLWEFPGGKLEDGETHARALVRELKEELGIDIRVEDLVELDTARGEPADAARRITVNITLFLVTRWDGEPLCLEGEAIGWFSTNQLDDLQMPPLDYPLAEHLRTYLAKEAK
ncbi:MAG: (deoxy)nucleoside triphosphate pyrophosphohydrolase [Novosphingobium sp.]